MSKTIGVKLSDDVYKQFTDLVASIPGANNNSLLKSIIEKYLESGVFTNPPNFIEVQNELERLQKENEELKSQLNNQPDPAKTSDPKDEEEIYKQSLLVLDLRKQVRELNSQLQNQPQGVILGPLDYVVKMKPRCLPFLEDMAAYETRNKGREVTVSEMIMQSIWKQIENGTGDWLPKTYSRTQMASMLTQAREEGKI